MQIRHLLIVTLLSIFLGAKPAISQTMETDHPPIFQGGMSQLSRYLSENLHLPTSVVTYQFGGKAVVRFVVDTNGVAIPDSVFLDQMKFGKKRLTEEEQTKAKTDLIAEIKRMISAMPNWVPGIQKGVAVRVRYHLPLNVDPH